MAVLCLWCIIAHKMIFSPSFHCENMATKVPHFLCENPTEFHVWCAMAHRQGFVPMYSMRFNMFIFRRVKTHESIKHINACRIHEEINVTS